MQTITTVLLLGLALAPGMPDVLPPGHKGVRHELVIVADEGSRPWQFVAAPWPGLHGARTIEAGKPFQFSTKYGTRLWAFAPGDEIPGKYEPAAFEGRPNTRFGFHEVSSTPWASPLARVVTTLRVTGVGETGIDLARVTEERFDKRGNPVRPETLLPWLLGFAALGAAGCFVLAKRRRDLERTHE